MTEGPRWVSDGEVDSPIYWVRLRDDVVRSVESCALTARDVGVYAYLCAKAGQGGETWTSSKVLATTFPRDFKSERAAKACLARLQKAGLLVSGRQVGSRCTYPVRVADLDRFAGRTTKEPRNGPHTPPPSCEVASASDVVGGTNGPRRGPHRDPRIGRREGPRDGPPLLEKREEEDTHPPSRGLSSASPSAPVRVPEGPTFALLQTWNDAGRKRRTPMPSLSADETDTLLGLWTACGCDEARFRKGLAYFFDEDDEFLRKRGWDLSALRGRTSGVAFAANEPPPVPRYREATPIPKRTDEETERARVERKKALEKVRALGSASADNPHASATAS